MNLQEFKEKVEELFGHKFHLGNDSEYRQVRSYLGRVLLVTCPYGPAGSIKHVEYAVRGNLLELRPRHVAARWKEPSQDFSDVFEQLESMAKIQARRHGSDLANIEKHIAELELIRKCAVQYMRHEGPRPSVRVVLANSDIALFDIYGDYINYEPSSKALAANGFTDMRLRAPNKAATVAEMMLLPITDKKRSSTRYVPRRADIFVSNARYVLPTNGENPYVEFVSDEE